MQDAYSPRPWSFAFFPSPFPPRLLLLVDRYIDSTYNGVSQWESSWPLTVEGKRQYLSLKTPNVVGHVAQVQPRVGRAGRYPMWCKISRCRLHERKSVTRALDSTAFVERTTIPTLVNDTQICDKIPLPFTIGFYLDLKKDWKDC